MTRNNPKSIPGYTWRPARREDAGILHEMMLAVNAADQTGWTDTLEERQRDFEDSSTDVENGTRLAFTSDGRLAALAWIFAFPASDEENVAYLWWEVHPEHRGRGLGAAALAWTEEQASLVLRTRLNRLPKILRSGTTEGLRYRQEILESLGFEPVRSYYFMHCDLNHPLQKPAFPTGIRLVSWDQRYELLALQAFNASFRDHWGYHPINQTDWELWFTRHPDFHPELSFLALVDSPQGAHKLDERQNWEVEENPVAGFCINFVPEETSRERGQRVADIKELGVRREYRRCGIGTSLLYASLQTFQQTGYEVAQLGVDAENTTGALRIYQRAGFQLKSCTITYSKTVQ